MKVLKINYKILEQDNTCIIKDVISNEVIIAFKINMNLADLKEYFYFGAYEPNMQKLIEKIAGVHTSIFEEIDEKKLIRYRYMRPFIELYEYSLIQGEYLEKFYEHITGFLSDGKFFRVSYMLKETDVNNLDLSPDNPCVEVSPFDGSHSDLLIIDYSFYKDRKAKGELNSDVICVIGQNQYEILIGPVFKNEAYIFDAEDQGIQKYTMHSIEKFERKLVEFFISKYTDIVCFKLNEFSAPLDLFPSRGVIHINRLTLDLVHEAAVLLPEDG